jgi:hypothetical protein
MEGLLVGIALGAFIVWLLWHGSEGGWLFALGSTLFTLVGLTLMGPGVELASILLIASGVAQLLTLVSSPVRAHIWARPRPEAASG